MKNYGDNLFQLASVLGARAYWGVDEPLILNHKPQASSSKLIGKCKPILILSEKFFSLLRLYRLVVDSKEVQKVVFSGGSLFGESRSYVTEIFIKSRSFRRNYFSAIGVSVGPFTTSADERRVTSLLRTFDYISTRDQASFERVSGMGLPAKLNSSADLAGVLPLLSKDFRLSKTKGFNNNRVSLRIGFSPCKIYGDSRTSFRYCEIFCNWVSLLRSEGYDLSVVLIQLNHNYYYGDSELISFAGQKLRSASVPCCVNSSNGNIIKTWQSIADMDFYVSARLHGAITSYLNGVPFFLFEYHEKCSEFLDLVSMPSAARVRRTVSKDFIYHEALNRARFLSLGSLLAVSRFSEAAKSNFSSSPAVPGPFSR